MRHPSLSRFALAASLALLALAAAGCVTRSSPVTVHLTPGEDLSRYRSWQWETPYGPAGPELDAVIREAVTEELAERGYHQVEGHWPELIVSYAVTLLHELEIRTETAASQFVSSYQQAQSFEVTASERKARLFETGILSVRVDLAFESHPAWRAVQATRARRSFTPRAADSVAELFETFPALSQPRLPSETTELDHEDAATLAGSLPPPQ